MSARAIRVLTGKVPPLPTAGAKMLLLRLTTLHKEGELLRCSIKHFARLLGVKPETVRNALQALERAGHVQVIDGLVILRMEEPVPANQVGEIYPEEALDGVSEGTHVRGEGGPLTGPGGGRPLAPKGAGQRPPIKEEDQKNARVSVREEIGYLPSRWSEIEETFLRALAKAGILPEAAELALVDAHRELAAARARHEVPAWLEKAGGAHLLAWAWHQFQRRQVGAA